MGIKHVFTCFQLEEYETKLTAYAEKIVKLTVKIEKMEKNPDDYNDADIEEIKVEIKQVEALIKELQLSMNTSTSVFESLRVQVSTTFFVLFALTQQTLLIHWWTSCLFSDHSHGGDSR